MLIVAICLFILAAIFGLVILTAILKNQPTPKRFVFSHGPIAVVALILVILHYMQGNHDGLLYASLVIFILAALGGLTLFTIDMSKRPIPKSLALLHPLAAATALVLLIIYVLKS
jgi:hypothetical protein